MIVVIATLHSLMPKMQNISRRRMTTLIPPLPCRHLVPTSSALLINLQRPSGPCRRPRLNHAPSGMVIRFTARLPPLSVPTRCKAGSARRRSGWTWTQSPPCPEPALLYLCLGPRPHPRGRTGHRPEPRGPSPHAAFAPSPAFLPRASLDCDHRPFQPSGVRLGSNCPIFNVAAASPLGPLLWSPALSSHLSTAFPPAEA